MHPAGAEPSRSYFDLSVGRVTPTERSSLGKVYRIQAGVGGAAHPAAARGLVFELCFDADEVDIGVDTPAEVPSSASLSRGGRSVP
jgi:hypothetical protein